MSPTDRARRRFLSLKWKAIILTSLLLSGLTIWFTIRGYRGQLEQFDRERALVHAKYEAELKGVIAQSLQRLSQIGSMVPTLSGMGPALQTADASVVRKGFDEHWPVLQINMGLEVARLYDAGARFLGAWNQTGRQDYFPTPVPPWILDAISREQPRSGIECDGDCMQYAAVPLLDQGQNRGVVVLGSSLADVVLGFKQMAGAEVGLLVADRTPEVETDRTIPAWGVRVAALTDLSHSLDVLRNTAAAFPDVTALNRGVRVQSARGDFEVLLVPLESLRAGQQAHLVILTDISQPLAEIRDTAHAQLYIGVVGLLLGELLLLALLGPPMARLRRTAENLPLLAEGGFQRVRDSLIKGRPAAGVLDEIDILDATTAALANRLESLENEVQEHSVALKNQMDALSAERDFVTSLLDTAQVVVLTQTSDGEVTMLNQFGRLLVGSPETTAEPLHFQDLIADAGELRALSGRLREMETGRALQVQHEAEMTCRDGSRRQIAWLHSRLARRSGQAPQVLSVGMDVTARKNAESRLAWLSEHDALTGLFNRRRFTQEVERALAVAHRYKRSGAVLLVDLDQFKYINDATGHQVGDLLLNVVARALQRTVRSVDTLARLSSDEFGILVNETDEAGAVDFAKKITAEIGGIEFPIEGARHRIGASIGIVVFPGHAAQAQDLLAAADLAMNQAKEQGRGQWHVYSPQTEARRLMHDHVFWRNRVEQALAQDRLVMHYQPILNLVTGRVDHYEALVRLLDRDGSIIPPSAFIPACERTGLIHTVDAAVLEKVVSQLAQLAPGHPETRIHANLSAHAFDNPDFLTNLRQTLRDHGVAPERLVLELTETATVADFSAARALMEDIRRLGCSLALDDFGVGFSSLGYLKELPVDYVKIDGSFIRRLNASRDDQILVRAMGEVARGFGKKIVAEYVENQAVLDLLEEYGIDYAQGYAIGAPEPPEEVFRDTSEMEDSDDAFEVLII